MTCTVSLVDVSGLAGGWVRNTRRDDASLDRHPSAHRAPRARSAPAGASRQRTSSFPVPEGSAVAAALTDRRPAIEACHLGVRARFVEKDEGFRIDEGLSRPPQLAACRYVRRSRSEEHTSELQSLMRITYAVFCLKKKNKQ